MTKRTYRDFGYDDFVEKRIEQEIPAAEVPVNEDNYVTYNALNDLNFDGLPDLAIPGVALGYKWIDDEAAAAGAVDTGWVAPTAFTDTNSAWANEGNAYASDDSYATATLASTYLRYLYYYTFDFSSIPGGAVITGIEVSVECHWSGKTPYTGVKSLSIGQGTTHGANNDDRRYGCQYYPTTADNIVTVGGNGDVWIPGVTRAFVQNSTFGVLFGTTSGLTSTTNWALDCLLMKIYYTT